MEETFTDKIDYDNFIQGRVLQDSKILNILENEFERFEELVQKDPFLNKFFQDKKIRKCISVIDRNFSHDTYKVDFEDKQYLLKVGSEIDSVVLEKESNILRKLQNKNLTAQFIKYAKGDFYCYLLTSYEHGFSLKDLGSEHFLNDLQTIAEHLFMFHEIDAKNEKDKYIDDVLAMGNFKYVLGKDYEELIKNDKVEQLIGTLEHLKRNIKIQSDFEENKSFLCHLNLNESNIFYRSGMYKFLNLQDSYCVSPMWEIAHLSINLNLHGFPVLEKKFFDTYASLSGDDFGLDYSVLQDYKSLAFKIQFYKLISNYIYKCMLIDDKKTLLEIFSKYQQLRSFIKNEMTGHLMFLEDIFYNTN